MENKRDRGVTSVYFAVAGGILVFILIGSFFSGSNPVLLFFTTDLTAPTGLIGAILADQAVCDPNVDDKALFIYSRLINIVIFSVGILIALYVKHLMSGGGFHM